MSRATYRVHLTTHHNGHRTGRLLPRRGGVMSPSGYGETDEDVLAQLALALEELEGDPRQFLWDEKLESASVKVRVHPQSIVKKQHVIANEEIEFRLAYAWSTVKAGGFRILVPRFDWQFLIEDRAIAVDVVRQLVATEMLGKTPRALFEFRAVIDERVFEWTPTLSKRRSRARGRLIERTPALHAIAEDLVAQERRLRRPIVGELDVRAAVELLSEPRGRSLLIVGPPGGGKTTWVRALALALNRSRNGQSVVVWSTSADRIVSGMRYLGEWEQRCLDIVDEIRNEGDVLYLDHLAPLLASQPGGTSIADMLIDAIMAGEIRVIVECTPEEYERLSIRHGSLMRAFIKHRLKPLNTGSMPSMLAAYQSRIDPQVTIDGKALRQLVTQLEFFDRARSFPGKGFRFLDWFKRYHASQLLSKGLGTIDSIVLSEAFSAFTGLPLELISEAHTASRELIASKLRAGVIGQDEACSIAARVLTRFKTGVGDPQRPIGSLFLVGPTGVGKTEMAKQLARYMFGDEQKMIRLDMSEYMLPGAAQRLLLAGQGAESLVEQVRKAPLTLILLDEIEKAHPEVFDLLLAMLGEGRMTDARGSLVDFRMALIVMTSNLGVRGRASPGFGRQSQSPAELVGAVRRHFRPEFFNRIDYVVPFQNLHRDDLLEIVRLELDRVRNREGIRRRQLRLVAGDAARSSLATAGWHPTRGARPLRRVIEDRVVTPLAARMAADPKFRDRVVQILPDKDTVVRLDL